MSEHIFTEGERKCLEEYWKTCGKTPRKNLIKLVRHINMFNPFPTEKSWEYIFFDRQLTDEMVDFALKMKLRKAYYIDELARREGMSVEDTAKLADEMVHIGILEYNCDAQGVDRVQLPVFAPGAMESTVMTKERTDRFPETAPAFLNYVLELQKKISWAVPMGQALMRAIPVEQAIQNEPRKVKYEEISYWLDKAGDSIGVAPCECRKLRRMVGEGTADLEGEWCINLGAYAESCIRVGKARRITREEAEHIIREAERLGYVHQLSNIDGPDFSLFICNCCWDTCMALKTSWYTQSPSLSRSNYIAEVEPQNCVACGGCVEVCPQNAVKLGQKLCQKTPVEVKQTVIPDNKVFFGKEHWQTDFLTERKNVVPETGTAPCKTNCPAHIAVQGYLKKSGEGKYMEALELIKKENPFPAVCGDVCARFCEQVCTRGDVDQPVAIDEVKKFVARRELEAAQRFVPQKLYDHGHKIAVIGSGPAGLSCAYYLAVYGHDVTVFEKDAVPGGMMVTGIPSFRLEKDVVAAEIDVLRALGVEIKCGVEVGKDVTLRQLREQGYKGFYVAIGAQKSAKLRIPGEELEGVMGGIDFLRKVNQGETVTLGKRVAVIGGGNVAMDVVRTAVRLGAEQTYIVYRRSEEEMPADKEEVAEAMAEGVQFRYLCAPVEILGADGKVCGLKVERMALGEPDEKGRRKPVGTGEFETLEVDNVLGAIGQVADWGNLLEGSKVALNKKDYAEADSWTYQTAEPDIFVGGDIYTGPRFVIDAIAAGKEGANSLHRYVHEGHSLTLGRVKRDNFKYLDKDNLAIGEYDTASRQKHGVDETKVKSFRDERLPFTEEQVKAETARCLSCGAAKVDSNICIGCGLCTTRCGFDAIHLHRKYDAWGVEYEQLVGYVVKTTAQKVGRRIVKKEI